MTLRDSTEQGETEIADTDRIEVLKQRHASLETALEEEVRRPLPDTSVVANLKREKLAIKDELQRLSAD